MFDFFKKKPDETDNHVIHDENNFVVDMYGLICEKCKYGDAMENLNAFERVFYVTQELEAEVNNGGFSQFFYNSSGDFSNELVHVFTEIGAYKTAEICKKALSAFGRELPADRTERENILDEMDWDGINDILSQCDDAFYNYEEDLNALNRAYIMQHREFFDRYSKTVGRN